MPVEFVPSVRSFLRIRSIDGSIWPKISDWLIDLVTLLPQTRGTDDFNQRSTLPASLHFPLPSTPASGCFRRDLRPSRKYRPTFCTGEWLEPLMQGQTGVLGSRKQRPGTASPHCLVIAAKYQGCQSQRGVANKRGKPLRRIHGKAGRPPSEWPKPVGRFNKAALIQHGPQAKCLPRKDLDCYRYPITLPVRSRIEVVGVHTVSHIYGAFGRIRGRRPLQLNSYAEGRRLNVLFRHHVCPPRALSRQTLLPRAALG